MVTAQPSPAAYKKATAMLGEAARARLRGPFARDTAPSSAAPPGPTDSDDRLVDLVDEFYNEYDQHGTDARVGAKDVTAPRSSEWREKLRAILADAAADMEAAQIRAEAERVVREAAPANTGGVEFRKRLVERLRATGFNAGLCRSSWEKSSSIPAPGSHEYVDVTMGSSPSSSTRYIVEVNIASEFDIARPSAAYQDLLRALPPVLVARPDAFEQVAAAMCAAAADSIRGAGMHLAPWRRARYVQAKWSAHYERVAVVTRVATARRAVPPAAAPGARPAGQEAAARVVAHVRRPSGGRKNCGMEMVGRELAMGREALMNVKPLFRGM